MAYFCGLIDCVMIVTQLRQAGKAEKLLRLLAALQMFALQHPSYEQIIFHETGALHLCCLDARPIMSFEHQFDKGWSLQWFRRQGTQQLSKRV